MPLSKTKIVIDATNFKSSADPLRQKAKKFWTREERRNFEILKKDNKSEIGESLESAGAPFEIVFNTQPRLNEKIEFYEFEQKVILKANKERIAQMTDPATEWESFIKNIFYPNLEADAEIDANKEYAVYYDHAFKIELPYSEKELKLMNVDQKTNTANIKPEYNFYIEGYEEEIREKKIPEQLLPSLYALKEKEVNERSSGKTINNNSLDGLIGLDKSDTMSAGQILKKRTKPLDHGNIEEQPFDKYLKNYGKNYARTTRRASKRIKKLKRQMSTMSFSNHMIENIAEYNEKSYIFPMYTNIEFLTDYSTYIAEILRETNLSTSFMNYVMHKDVTKAHNKVKLTEAQNKMMIKRNVELEDSYATKTKFKTKERAMFDFIEWWENYYNNEQNISETLSDMSITIGSDANDADNHGTIRSQYLQQVHDMVFQSKVRKFIKNYTRSFSDILKGSLSHSETLMYKIQKFLGDPTGQPIQVFYTCNSNQVEVMSLFDTQVKYDTEYTYVITAYQLVLGTEYGYSNIEIGSQYNTVDDTTDYLASFVVNTRPSMKVIEVPIFAEKERIIDSPPVAPDIDIIPYRAINNRLLFNFNGNVGEYELHPIFFNEEEREHYERLRIAQKVLPGNPINFSSDDPASVFEVFRITTRPKSYQDFKDAKRASVYTDVSEETIQKASTASYVEHLSPNIKYYYIFRSIDVHGHISYPSAVYEVELVDDAGMVYPMIKVIDFEPEIPKTDSKKMKKHIHILPNLAQVFVNAEKSGLVNEYGEIADSANSANGNIQLGFQESPIWNKRFKIRLTSRQSGRKIDLNISFIHKHITTESDYINKEAFRDSSTDVVAQPSRMFYQRKRHKEMDSEDLLDLL
tara:strand:+ start:2895 stop:5480 length:2586 start_codon:yes stop_codon:yes gene_type:complete